jgi:hypothetical protein
VNNQTDFLISFKKFNVEVISKIGALYIETLFELLKKDILILIRIIVADIAKSEIAKKNLIIQSSLQALPVLITLISAYDDYRKCKSLIDSILLFRQTNNCPKSTLGWRICFFKRQQRKRLDWCCSARNWS